MKLPDELKKEVYDDLAAFNAGKKLNELDVPDKYHCKGETVKKVCKIS